MSSLITHGFWRTFIHNICVFVPLVWPCLQSFFSDLQHHVCSQWLGQWSYMTTDGNEQEAARVSFIYEGPNTIRAQAPLFKLYRRATWRQCNGHNCLKLMTLQAIFDHFYLELNPSDNADRQVSTCSIQWCKKTTFEEVVACALIVYGPSYDGMIISNLFELPGMKMKPLHIILQPSFSHVKQTWIRLFQM